MKPVLNFILNPMIKNKICFLLIPFLVALLPSCTKQTESKLNSLIITGIKNTKGSEMVSIRLDSGVISTTPVNCYVLGSTVFDSKSGGYGYVGCDSVFKLVNPLTGELIKSFKVPGGLSQTVIDSHDNMLIGRYTTISYEDDPDTVYTNSVTAGAPIYTNYVIRVDLATGTIVSQNQVDLGDGAFLCSNFYDPVIKGYVLLRSDYKLITINPSTGAIVKSTDIGKSVGNIVYNSDNKTLIGMTYSYSTDRNYVEVIDTETGAQISKKEIKQRDDYYLCISGYDAESNCYLAVNYPQNNVLFINISTGEIDKSYKLDNPMNDIKFWRGR